MNPQDNPAIDKEFIHSATFLPLKSWHFMIQFQLMTSKVLKQAKQSNGVVDYAVKADFPRKHFWTLSIWKDRDAMKTFVTSEPHATAVKKFSEWAGAGAAFVEWTSKSNTIDWVEAMKRLENPTFYYNKGTK
jgi:quinol monooxygenase YgiN